MRGILKLSSEAVCRSVQQHVGFPALGGRLRFILRVAATREVGPVPSRQLQFKARVHMTGPSHELGEQDPARPVLPWQI